jgi:hypothetical protein
MYRRLELETLVEQLQDECKIRVVDSGFDTGNWYILFKRSSSDELVD